MQANTPQPHNFLQYRLSSPKDLELFIKYDRTRYLAFLKNLNEALKSLPLGSTLYARDYVTPKQYNIFVKLCSWLAFLSRNAHLPPGSPPPPTYLEMLPDLSGITKKKR